jgi:hypothetical protein
MLFTGLSVGVDDLMGMKEFTFRLPTTVSEHDTRPPKTAGLWDSVKGFCSIVPPAMSATLRRPLGLVLSPTSWISPRPRMHTSQQAVAPLVEKNVHLDFWATPRCRMGCSNYLSRRTKTDLRTQIRFEQGTEGREQYINPEFVEWMQGYPLDWTRVHTE